MKRVFNLAKKLLPRISDTEMIALRSGTVSFDRNVMANTVDKFNFKSLKNEFDTDYFYNEVPKLYKTAGTEPVFKDGIFNEKLREMIKETKAFHTS